MDKKKKITYITVAIYIVYIYYIEKLYNYTIPTMSHLITRMNCECGDFVYYICINPFTLCTHMSTITKFFFVI